MFTNSTLPRRLVAVDLTTGERTDLVEGERSYFTSSGHLVFAAPDGKLMAAGFDPEAVVEKLGFYGDLGQNAYPEARIADDQTQRELASLLDQGEGIFSSAQIAPANVHDHLVLRLQFVGQSLQVRTTRAQGSDASSRASLAVMQSKDCSNRSPKGVPTAWFDSQYTRTPTPSSLAAR